MNNRQQKTLEETWAECEGPFTTVLTKLIEGLDRKKYMSLYTYVVTSPST